MISEGSCDTDNLSNDCWIQLCHHRNRLHFELYSNGKGYFKSNFSFYFIFEQINTDFDLLTFKNKNLKWPQTFARQCILTRLRLSSQDWLICMAACTSLDWYYGGKIDRQEEINRCVTKYWHYSVQQMTRAKQSNRSPHFSVCSARRVLAVNYYEHWNQTNPAVSSNW